MLSRLHIIGAGNIGCLLGSQLLARGTAVTFLERTTSSSIQPPKLVVQHGVAPDAPTTSLPVNVTTAAELPPADPLDAVIVATKAHQLTSALKSLGSAYVPGHTALALIQNGYGRHIPLIDETSPSVLGELPILLGSTTHGCFRDTSSSAVSAWRHIVHAGSGAWHFGPASAEPLTPQAAALLDVLGDLPDATAYPGGTEGAASMQSLLLTKLAVNASINAATAAADVRNGAVVTIPAWRKVVAELAAETAAVFVARAARFPSEFAGGLLPPTLTSGDSIMALVDEVCATTASNWSSTHADVWTHRRSPDELAFINGTVVRWGREVGVPTPMHEEVLGMVAERVRELGGGVGGSDLNP
ncbi:2-dehydropantoate 2-reductase (Ketopantoate reductase) (KPA reductase) (KPR) [Blastocladiella emersonii ATCC 22665]|nr:2-dehydropantoate 2-reductase (Ketopantoate reductase) (KPA reductase) (KPR) [Blastocladiella emersonii ATCC 22665]KAI9148550.1 2-dehydropantoate 2-reductase (Ketopantoate reductase) (KPA reductase) (KPR) [Blastocladiella emersonii ATCC 22665]